MIMVIALILSLAAAWIANQVVRFGYRLCRRVEEWKFERWLASHPEV